MRVLVLFALLFAFTAGSYGVPVYAAATDFDCTHHQVEHDHSADAKDEPCSSGHEQDQEQCDDCCCIHSHSMTTTPIPVAIPSHVKRQNMAVPIDSYSSAELSGLRRPPRL